jgi:hypothetical protein
MKPKKIKVSEREVQKNVMDYLKLTGWSCYRLNNGGVYNQKANCWIFNGKPGVSDLLATNIKLKVMMFIECKASTGGKLSPDQKNFLEEVNKVEKIYGICVNSLDELVANLSDNNDK